MSKAVFLCTTVKLQSCHILAHRTEHTGPSTFQPAFIWAMRFNPSMKFFQLRITLGLALDKTWSLLAQPQKNTDVHKGVLLWESFPRQICRNHLRRKQGWKLMDQIWTVQFFCNSFGRSFCRGNEHCDIDPSIFSSGPSWLFHKGCLSLNCCQTAILPHLGTSNSTYWALSAFQSSFIWAIGFGCSMTLWSVHKGVPKQTCKNCLRWKQACKLMDQIWTVQQFCASPGRSFCHGNEHHGIDPSIFSSGPSWLFHKGWLSIPVEITQEDLCNQFVVTTRVLTTCALTERPAPPPPSLTQRYHRSRVSIKKGLLQKGHDHMLWSKITTHYLQSCTVWVDLAIAFCRHNCLNKS